MQILVMFYFFMPVYLNQFLSKCTFNMKKKREEKNMYQVKYKAKFTYYLMLNNIPPK